MKLSIAAEASIYLGGTDGGWRKRVNTLSQAKNTGLPRQVSDVK